MKACVQAAADFEEVIQLKPHWAEAYNLEAGVYTDCPDLQYRDPAKAIAPIEHAIALDVEHPAYLTVLALSYFRSGSLDKAIITQRQALESPRFPPGYREVANEPTT
jgi:Flp pilus assembly protein TadD